MASESKTLYELFHISYGVEHWRYTSTNNPIEYMGNTYEPEIISASGLTASDDFIKTDLKITIDTANEFVRRFVAGSPDVSISVEVIRYNPDTGIGETFFKGEVYSVTLNKLESVIDCNTVNTELSKNMMSNFYQRSCRHVLYSPFGCRLNRAPYTIVGEILSITGNTLIVEGVTSSDPNYYISGEIFVGNEGSTIEAYNTITKELTVMKSFINASVGDIANVSAGCNHTPEECQARGNIYNYGGYLYIPEKNPLTKLV